MLTKVDHVAMRSLAGVSLRRWLAAQFMCYALLTVGLVVPVVIVCTSDSLDAQTWAAIVGASAAALASLPLRDRNAARDRFFTLTYIATQDQTPGGTRPLLHDVLAGAAGA